MTAAGAPRDDGPASSADGADAGPVVSGGRVIVTFPDDGEGLALRAAYPETRSPSWFTPVRVTGEETPSPIVDLGANEELIRSTRAEFPDDSMRWTPPPEGEDVPPWP